jgi:hypothetical protein
MEVSSVFLTFALHKGDWSLYAAAGLPTELNFGMGLGTVLGVMIKEKSQHPIANCTLVIQFVVHNFTG